MDINSVSSWDVSSSASYYLERLQTQKEKIETIKQGIELSEQQKTNTTSLNSKLKDFADFSKNVETVDASFIDEFSAKYQELLNETSKYATENLNKYDVSAIQSALRGLASKRIETDEGYKTLKDIGVAFDYDQGNFSFSVSANASEEMPAFSEEVVSAIGAELEKISSDFAKVSASDSSAIDRKNNTKKEYIARLEQELSREIDNIEMFMARIQNQQNLLDQMSMVDYL